MNVAGTMTTDDIPPEVLEQMENQETVDFGGFSSDPTDFVDGMFTAMPVMVGLFMVFFVAVIGFMIFVWVRNYKTTKNAGMDIFTLETELATRAAKSQMLAPKKTLEEKLAELDGLLARGVITRDEYTQARLKALTD